MYSVKLTDKACLFCGKAGDTAVLKSKEHDSQLVVCGEHLFALLKKWERQGHASSQDANESKSAARE